MPYIEKGSREKYDKLIEAIIEKLLEVEASNGCKVCSDFIRENAAKGELNYIIASIIGGFIAKKGLRYFRLQDFITGTMGACEHELLRRLADPYEDKAIERNGDLSCFGAQKQV